VPLLDLDPDLGQFLSAGRLHEARRRLIVELDTIERGPWQVGERMESLDFGMLISRGLIVRESALSDSVSAELLGPGDVIRPWQAHPSRLLEAETRLTVVERTTCCVFDTRFVLAARAYPEVTAALIDRLVERTQRVAAEKAIAQLNGIDRRVVALFWELAERWGRVTAEGVVVPLSLPHRILAQLIGARRPTVSTALARLARKQQLIHRDDGTWLLPGAPVGRPTGDASRWVRARRRAPAQVVAAP
jgi:CRP-like cAMP-binding protein